MSKLTFTTFLTILLALLFLSACNQVNESNESILAEDELFNNYLDHSKSYEKEFAYDTAIRYGDSALALAIDANDKEEIAQSMARIGTIYKNSNDLDSSSAYLFAARSICLQTANVKLQGYIESIIGKVYRKRGISDSAIYYLENAIVLKEEVADSFGLAKVLNALGSLHKDMRNYDVALQNYLRALGIYENLKDEQRQAYVLLNIGNVHLLLGKDQESTDEYKKGLELYQKCKAVSVQAQNHQMIRVSSENIASAYFRLKQYDKAEQVLLEVIELCKKYQDDYTLASCYFLLSQVYDEDAKPELSLELMKKAQDLAKQMKIILVEIRYYNDIGILYRKTGKIREAEKNYQKAISLAKQYNYMNPAKAAYNNLSNLYEDEGNFKKALSYRHLYTNLKDSIINERKLEIIYELETKYEKKKDEAEILRLSNENAEKEIRNKDLKIVLVTVTSIVILLVGILFFIRLRNRKDKIIAKQRIQQLEEEQKLLAAQSVIVGQENERKRVAQELHDGIGVLLSTASIHFSNVEESSTDEKTAELLSKANKLLKEASGEVRKISHDMMPGVLSKFGLQEALEDIFENVEDTGTIDVDCDIELGEERLSENTEIILYRIVQEILNNTLKHANAKQISFDLKKEGNKLVINYKDDGNGFDQSKIQAEKSLGLSGIKSRIDFLKGEMKLISSPGNGIQYDIIIPVGRV